MIQMKPVKEEHLFLLTGLLGAGTTLAFIHFLSPYGEGYSLIGVALALVFFGILYHLLSAYFKNRFYRSVFKGREGMTEAEIYRQYYEKFGIEYETFLEAWKHIANFFKLNGSLLRPADRFGEEILGYELYREELDDLALLLREKAKKMNLEVDLERIKTLDDYIKAFCLKTVSEKEC